MARSYVGGLSVECSIAKLEARIVGPCHVIGILCRNGVSYEELETTPECSLEQREGTN
jgi:hypothetical protein